MTTFSSKKRTRSRLKTQGLRFAWSAEFAGDLLQKVPGGGAVFLLPLSIEVCAGECLSEIVLLNIDERDALGLQVRLQAVTQFRDICPLVARRLVEFAGDNCLYVGRQLGESPFVAKHPVAVPDMPRQATGLLHFIEPCRRNDGQRILLALNHLGLKRGVDFVEVDWRGRGV